MTNMPQEPLDEPVDVAGDDAARQAPVSGTPAEAHSDVGYSRGDQGESAEQTGQAVTGEGTDYLDSDLLRFGGGDSDKE